jgi:DNA adenine methylase
MADRVQAALGRARALLGALAPAPVEKTIWGSPAGKKRLAPRLVKLLPKHRVYVEPFAGSAAVLFEKEPAEVEVINDADAEIAKAYQTIQKLTPKKLAALRSMSWTGDEATFKKLLDAQPRGELEQLHRFLYLTHFSYGKMRGRTFSPNVQGIEAKTIGRLEQHAPRLAKVKVYSGDYSPVVRRYDGADTVFFLDPPYPGYNVDVGESEFDEERFFEVLKALEGKWLMTYGVRGKLPGLLKDAGFHIKRIRTPRTIGAMRGVGGPSVLTQLLVANYKFVEKHTDAHAWLEDWQPAAETASAPPIEKVCTLLKDLDPDDERYVLGVVLVPERVDAQGDVYSHEEVRQAAHRFMEEFGGLGLMHQLRVNDQVKVLESYLAPVDLQVGDVAVPKGTWLLAVRVQSDELWERVRAGELTGFSIGGSARRVPEPARAEPADDAPAGEPPAADSEAA